MNKNYDDHIGNIVVSLTVLDVMKYLTDNCHITFY